MAAFGKALLIGRQSHSWPNIPRLVALALAYALLAELVLAFFSSNYVISLIWPPSGLALAALLTGGVKYWPGVFIGALAGNFMAGNSLGMSLAIAAGNTLEALTGLWLLSRQKRFDRTLPLMRDYLCLVLAGTASSCVSASNGVITLLAAGLLAPTSAAQNFLQWWQGDLLGMVLISPLILVWRHPPQGWLQWPRMLETFACFGLTFLSGQVIFLGWLHDSLGNYSREFFMVVFVAWGAVRFGRHGAMLAIGMTMAQALLGTAKGIGPFPLGIAPANLIGLWLYLLVLSLVGLGLALSITERNDLIRQLRQSHDLLGNLSAHMPGIIFQLRTFPDGRAYFPFASESISGIYGITPEQVREDAAAMFDILHPEDRAGIVASIQESARTLTPWRQEYRVAQPKLATRWSLGEATPEQLDDGSVILHGFITDISEQKRSEEKLQLLQSRLQLLLQSTPAVIYSCRAYGNFATTFISENIIAQTGHYPCEFYEDPAFWISHIPQEDRPSAIDDLSHAFAGGSRKQEYRFRHKNGDYRWMHDEAVLVHDSAGQPLEIVGFLLDITDRKQAEARIQRLTGLYRALSEVSQAIIRLEQQAELFPLVCRCAVEFGGMDMAWVGQLDDTGRKIVATARYGSHLDYLKNIHIASNADQAEGRGPTGTAWREKRSVVVNNYSADPRTSPWKNLAANTGWRAGAAFPIPRGDKPFAVLTVYHAHQDAFDQEAIALLEELSAEISFALDNFDREVQRRAAEESQRIAASVYENTSEAMMVTDADNHIIAVNPAFTHITGYKPDEVIGHKPNVLKSGRHGPGFYKAMWKEIRATGHWQGEVWDQRKNGEFYPKWLTINSILDDDGSLVRRIALFTDISQKKQSEELIWLQANFDSLTGLPNRRMFYDRLEQEIKKSQRAGRPLALLFLDLDHFKEVNDTLGHAKGDILLVEAARRLATCMREADTVARFGGDEFTIILSELEDIEGVDRVAQCVLKRLSEPFQLADNLAYVSASVGVTLYPDDGKEIEELLRNADQALYDAKNSGRNRYSYFTPAMQIVAQSRMKIANELRGALPNHQFQVAYQPIVDLKTGKICKAEALLRWNNPKLGNIRPDDFIPIAEHTGLIIEIGDWVFRQVAHQVQHWRKIHDPKFQVSVNKSPLQVHDKHLRREPWHEYLRRMGLPGNCIVVEITEGLLLEADAYLDDKLMELRDTGMQVALDDFGTGYSSLSYIQKFDIDYIKIDQSFMLNLASGSDDLALCEAIIVMAHKIGMKVVAEGIETEEQYRLMAQAGCDFGQGYLLGEPMPAEEFETLLANNRKLQP